MTLVFYSEILNKAISRESNKIGRNLTTKKPEKTKQTFLIEVGRKDVRIYNTKKGQYDELF